jgi:uncharacterized protein YgiM (DUF1202 family)
MRESHEVIEGYRSAFPDPLAARQGDELRVERSDSEWPGWVWCTSDDGHAGWVPAAWLERQDDGSWLLLRDYKARELTVRKGEVVELKEKESGWAWATASTGESGWIPLRNLGLDD